LRVQLQQARLRKAQHGRRARDEAGRHGSFTG
jgi:hypothetical protein